MEARPTILVAEDDTSLARGLGKALSAAGMAPTIAHDAQEAVRAMGQHSFAAIVLDVGLPSLDGLTLLRHLRQRGVRVPVLVISGRLGVERSTLVRSLRATFLQKPFAPEILVSRVRELVDSDDARPPTGAPSSRESSSSPRTADGPAGHRAADDDESLFRNRFRRSLAAMRAAATPTLPLLDPRVEEAHRLLAREEVSAVEVRTLIEGDMRVVSSVLAAANAGMFAQRGGTTDLSLAIARIGMQELAEIISKCITEPASEGAPDPFGERIRTTWRRSALAAKVAVALGPRLGLHENDAVYTATLLQDVGELAGWALAADAAAVPGSATTEQLAGWASHEVQCAHAGLGADLMKRWALPMPLPYVAANHHKRLASLEPLLSLTSAAHEVAAVMLADGDLTRTRMAQLLGEWGTLHELAESHAELIEG